jgi:hypothetical protein
MTMARLPPTLPTIPLNLETAPAPKIMRPGQSPKLTNVTPVTSVQIRSGHGSIFAAAHHVTSIPNLQYSETTALEPFCCKFSCLQIILQGTLQRRAVYATNFPTENFNLNVFLVRQRIITAQQEKAR